MVLNNKFYIWLFGICCCFGLICSEPAQYFDFKLANLTVKVKPTQNLAVSLVLCPLSEQSSIDLARIALQALELGVSNVVLVLPAKFDHDEVLTHLAENPEIIWAGRTAPVHINPHPSLINMATGEEHLYETKENGRTVSYLAELATPFSRHLISGFPFTLNISSQIFPESHIMQSLNITNVPQTLVLGVDIPNRQRYSLQGWKTGYDYIATSCQAMLNQQFLFYLPLQYNAIIECLFFTLVFYYPQVLKLWFLFLIVPILIALFTHFYASLSSLIIGMFIAKTLSQSQPLKYWGLTGGAR